jgi:hypothetical protein
MKHKDAHKHAAQPGHSSSAHRGSNPAAEHPAVRLGEGELLNTSTASDVADLDCEAMWIDIGGEG